jgi:fatty-acid desaturase
MWKQCQLYSIAPAILQKTRQELRLGQMLGSNANLLTHLCRSVLSRSLACAELSFAVAFSSIIIIAIITTRARAHHARTGHCVIEWIIRRCRTGGVHLVLISWVVGCVDLRKQLIAENCCAN